MEKTDISPKFQTIALFCAITALIVNLLMLTIEGIPLSVPLGIFGIAFSTLCKDKSEHMTPRGRTAMILSIIALVFGFLLFWLTVITTSTMADPVKSRMVMDAIRAVKDQLPAEIQEIFKQSGFPMD